MGEREEGRRDGCGISGTVIGEWCVSVYSTRRFKAWMKSLLPIPVLPAYAPAPGIDGRIVLRALLVTAARDLDMRMWNLAIQERECAEAQTEDRLV